MDDVKVHYNSDRPAQLNALAYAQGTDIHMAPGQEHHLPHEAWHVIQQKQGRVQPTMQLQGVYVNDQAALEKEADEMGRKAVVHRVGSEIESGVGAPHYGAPVPASLDFSPDRKGRTRVAVPLSKTTSLLNHYMVVRNGTQYQLPIRAVYDPYSRRKKKDTKGHFVPNLLEETRAGRILRITLLLKQV
ncbi:MAG: DUF4157 domain-containing protein [Tannerellaceae bacterium]|nr:DUF4157 domain-containing protein [Tannerellaceae bacterium]